MEGNRLYLSLLLITNTICTLVSSQQGGGDPEDLTNPHRDPSKCEVCKFVAIEMQGIMKDTGKNREIITVNPRKPRNILYKFSELRFIEATEGVCERILNYQIHAERDTSRRFSKGEPETHKVISDLRNKGVKVETGIPDTLWNEPSAPVQKLKKYCEMIVEEHEEALETWFTGDQTKTLIDYLCAERVLTREQSGCLREEWTGTERVDKGESFGDRAKDEQTNLDDRKIQDEIERQATQQQHQQEEDRERTREEERERKKRDKEMKRRQRKQDEL